MLYLPFCQYRAPHVTGARVLLGEVLNQFAFEKPLLATLLSKHRSRPYIGVHHSRDHHESAPAHGTRRLLTL